MAVEHQPRHDALELRVLENDIELRDRMRAARFVAEGAGLDLESSSATIYSLKDLREILLSCDRRYLEYLSSLDDFSAGIRALDRLAHPRYAGPTARRRAIDYADWRTAISRRSS